MIAPLSIFSLLITHFFLQDERDERTNNRESTKKEVLRGIAVVLI